MKTQKFIAVAVAATMLAGCQQGGPGAMNGGSGFKTQDRGTAAGAIAGGVAGYQFGGGAGKAVATVLGAGLGGLIGSELGKSLDNADRAAMGQASQRALETGQPGQALPWKGQNAYGTVTPGKYYQEDGRYCREYNQTVNIGGKTEKAYGTACRQSDGSWEVVR
jgi:surface antigen